MCITSECPSSTLLQFPGQSLARDVPSKRGKYREVECHLGSDQSLSAILDKHRSLRVKGIERTEIWKQNECGNWGPDASSVYEATSRIGLFFSRENFLLFCSSSYGWWLPSPLICRDLSAGPVPNLLPDLSVPNKCTIVYLFPFNASPSWVWALTVAKCKRERR